MDNSQIVDDLLKDLRRDKIRWCIDVKPEFPKEQLRQLILALQTTKVTKAYWPSGYMLSSSFVLPDGWTCLEFDGDIRLEDIYALADRLFKFRSDVRMGRNAKVK